MYTPPAFIIKDKTAIHAAIHAAGLAIFITATQQGPMVTPLPLFLDEAEGENGVLYGHLARANPQWQAPLVGEGIAFFSGPDAYVTPSWYASKAEHHKVVPTWNYAAVEARGPVEFFDEPARLHEVAHRLTERHEAGRVLPWAVMDAPEKFVKAQLRGIIGLRMSITTLTGKMKMSQNRSEDDRNGVREGLAGSDNLLDRMAGQLV